jgi:hypothetical protein
VRPLGKDRRGQISSQRSTKRTVMLLKTNGSFAQAESAVPRLWQKVECLDRRRTSKAFFFSCRIVYCSRINPQPFFFFQSFFSDERHSSNVFFASFSSRFEPTSVIFECHQNPWLLSPPFFGAFFSGQIPQGSAKTTQIDSFAASIFRRISQYPHNRRFQRHRTSSTMRTLRLGSQRDGRLDCTLFCQLSFFFSVGFFYLFILCSARDNNQQDFKVVKKSKRRHKPQQSNQSSSSTAGESTGNPQRSYRESGQYARDRQSRNPTNATVNRSSSFRPRGRGRGGPAPGNRAPQQAGRGRSVGPPPSFTSVSSPAPSDPSTSAAVAPSDTLPPPSTSTRPDSTKQTPPSSPPRSTPANGHRPRPQTSVTNPAVSFHFSRQPFFCYFSLLHYFSPVTSLQPQEAAGQTFSNPK